MQKSLAICGWIIALLLFSITPITSADIGVGVGTGKIDITEPIKSGSIYDLPPVTVFNTGDTKATYSMSVTLNEVQDELKPDPAWFSFTPATFDLEPGASKTVIPTFSPPLSTEPGKYFAYLEAGPSATANQGGTSIGVAAAAKLSFEVIPSNFFVAVYNRVKSLIARYAPWTYIWFGIIILALLLIFIKKHLHFEFRITKMEV